MKVGIVVESFDPQRGGVETWTHQFASRVVASGHEVHIVAEHFGTDPLPKGIVAHRLPRSSTRIDFAAAAERELNTMQLDVIHDTGCGWHCDIFQPHGGSRVAAAEQNLLLLPRWLRPLKRAIAASTRRYREFGQLLERQYAKNNDRLYLAISNMVASHLEYYHGVPSAQLRLVHNGVNTERFSPDHRAVHRRVIRARLDAPEETSVLLIVAHNYRLKGVPTLLEACKRLSTEGFPLHLVIAGGRRQGREQLGSDCPGEVTYLGAVNDVVPYYAAADLYVHPTLYDPCSLAVLEAMASGLPVVTTRFNGTAELLQVGVHGDVLENPFDVAELCGRLRPLLDRRVQRVMGIAARELALEHSLDRNCQEVLAVYQEAAERQSTLRRAA